MAELIGTLLFCIIVPVWLWGVISDMRDTMKANRRREEAEIAENRRKDEYVKNYPEDAARSRAFWAQCGIDPFE